MSYAGDITPQAAWELLESNPEAVLIDVRTELEWDRVGVPDTESIGRKTLFIEWVNSTGFPNPDFVTQLQSTGLTGPAIFLCRSGNRSIGAATTATRLGITPSYNVTQGFEGRGDGWKFLGLPWKQR